MHSYKINVKKFNAIYNLPIVYCDSVSDFNNFLDERAKIQDGGIVTENGEIIERNYVIVRVTDYNSHVAPMYVETTFSKDGVMVSQNILDLDSAPIPEMGAPFTISDPDNKRIILFATEMRQAAAIGCFEDSLILLKDFKYLQDNCPDYNLGFNKFLEGMRITRDASNKMASFGFTSVFPGFFIKHTEYWATLRAVRPTKMRSASPVPFDESELSSAPRNSQGFGNPIQLVPISRFFTSHFIENLMIREDRKNSLDEEIPKITDTSLKTIPEEEIKRVEMRYVNFERQHKTIKKKLSNLSLHAVSSHTNQR